MSETLDNQYKLVDKDPAHGFTTALLDPSDSKVEASLTLEQSIWDQKDYGSLDSYKKYLPQSKIFASFDENENCLGVVRVFAGNPELPPFMELPFENDAVRQQLVDGCQSGAVEELGTAAVANDAPVAKVALNLWRLAYRDARMRNVKHWGIIMEPRRVNVMNRRYGFTFTQVGPEVDYQGGNCAVHMLDLEEVDAYMSQNNPSYYDWFVNEPLHNGSLAE